MKKKFLFLSILVFVLIMILPLNIANATTNKVTLKSGAKGYIGKTEFKTSNTNEFGMSYIKKDGNSESLGTTNDDERFITIKLHSGTLGYFESEGEHVDVVESIQFKGDTFYDVRVPKPNDSSYMFLGWAKTEGATTPDIKVDGEGVRVDTIGEDLYAVWTNQCSVNYWAGAGYFNESIMDDPSITEIARYPDNKLFIIQKAYTCGSNFENIIPISNNSLKFDFEGWYNTSDEKMTTSTKVEGPEIEAHSNWIFKLDQLENIFDYIPLGQEKSMSNTTEGNLFYKLIPTETKIYEVYIKDAVGLPEETNSPKIVIYDEYGKQLAFPSPDTDVVTTFFKFEKGKSYVIELGEQAAHSVNFKAGIKEAEYKTVTFHSNRGNESYFNEPGVTEIEVPYSEGETIQQYDRHGLILANSNHLNFHGWVTEPDGEYDPDGEIIVTEDMDLYATYYETGSMILNAGNGVFTTHDAATSIEYNYIIGLPFDPAVMAKSNDNTKAFAGWSRNPNATKPDSDILEEVTPAEDIEGPLYAVYTDKILETWDANGGYFMQNPSVTTYTSTKGIGHDFWGMTLFHNDERMVALGWNVTPGNKFIPYTPNAYPYFHNQGDTNYKAIWGREITLDANGGIFENFEDVSALFGIFEYDEAFTLDDYKDIIGRIIPDDASKYFAGWATTSDATEPDVIEGETPVKNLTRIYAVWKDDVYYFVKGDNSNWIKGSDEGFSYTIKRQGDDTDTYDTFNNVFVDGNRLTSSQYTRKKGSLILTLKPEYLETLALGDHEVEFTFMGNKSIKTTLTIKEKGSVPDSETSEDSNDKKTINPKTGDNILVYLTIFILSIFGFIIFKMFIKKAN